MKNLKFIALIALFAHITVQGAASAAAAEPAKPYEVAAGGVKPMYDDEATKEMWLALNFGDSEGKALREILATGKADPNSRGEYGFHQTPLG